MNEKNYSEMINFFCRTMNILAIYGILQLLFRKERSPINIENFDLFNLALPGHMIPGCNWSNLISFGGLRFWRSNAIFIEPSMFSRFLAINIIFHLIKSEKTKFVWIIINVIAYICTFSGTGLILFASCILTCIVKSKNVLKKNILKNIVISFILIVAVLPLTIDVSTVIDHFASRLLEITSMNL
jgi:hypothetical protein